jgi:hypothetical protein
LAEMFDIMDALSIAQRMVGDPLIKQARRSLGAARVRYPACIYDGDQYCQTVYPLLAPFRDRAVTRFLKLRATDSARGAAEAGATAAAARVTQAEARATAAEARVTEAEARVIGALFIVEQYVAQNSELQKLLVGSQGSGHLEAELTEARNQLTAITQGNRHLVAELAEARSQLTVITQSTSWWITGPIRRLASPFPRLRRLLRALGSLVWRSTRKRIISRS